MQKYISWVGEHDFQIVYKQREQNLGPVYAFLNSEYSENIDEFHLLHSKKYREAEFKDFLKKIKLKFKEKKFVIHDVELSNPADYSQIYSIVTGLINKNKDDFYHIQTSSGTPQMAAVWLLLSKTILNENSVLYQGYFDVNNMKDVIKRINIPFDIEIDYLPEINNKIKNKLIENHSDLPEYEKIIYKSSEMEKILKLAYRVSVLDIPVILLGETGVGKEVIANAVHSSSSRKDNKFVTVNCAAFNESTIEATLFGWSKGAWTGAAGEGKGIFREANEGTIFLDEIGELSLNIQGKLLRVVENGHINRVGDGKEFKVDVRVIVATNRDLIKLVSENKFRRDLFYRLNVAVINISPLRDRTEDIMPLAEHFLNEQNKKLKDVKNFDYEEKSFTVSAKRFLKNFLWFGNVRELYHTIERAAIWGETDKIDEELLRSVVINHSENKVEVKINKESYNLPVNLEEYLDEIKAEYIKKALGKTNGSITKAAEILNYKNYQTLKNNMKALGVEKGKYE